MAAPRAQGANGVDARCFRPRVVLLRLLMLPGLALRSRRLVTGLRCSLRRDGCALSAAPVMAAVAAWRRWSIRWRWRAATSTPRLRPRPPRPSDLVVIIDGRIVPAVRLVLWPAAAGEVARAARRIIARLAETTGSVHRQSERRPRLRPWPCPSTASAWVKSLNRGHAAAPLAGCDRALLIIARLDQLPAAEIKARTR
jgi:hypothetical protein